MCSPSEEHSTPEGRPGEVSNPIAVRIRSLREGVGMSQGDLAARVLVSRQTIINWEKGRTLPDAQSLKLLSAAFGITLDALLDERSEGYLRQTERERRAIYISIAINAAWWAVWVIGTMVTGIAYKFLPWEQAHAVADVEMAVRSVILLALLFACFKVNRIKYEHGLESIADVAAFLEGYQPGAALPQTFVWRWVLPHWTLVNMVFAVFMIVVTYVPLIALELA